MLATRADLRGMLLAHQGLLGQREPGGTAGAIAWVRAQGFLLLETVGRALAPGQDLVLASRLAGYQAGDLEAALYAERALFEHPLHLLGALPIEDYALVYDPERVERAAAPGSMGEHIVACLLDEGPCTVRDLQARLRQDGRKGLRELSQAVHELYAAGGIMVRQREGNQAVYDLASRVIPTQPAAPLPLEERLQGLARKTLHFLAPVLRGTWSQVLGTIGTRAGLGLSEMKREKSRLINEMVASGEVVLAELEDSIDGYLFPASWLEDFGRPVPLEVPRVSFLSPLDPIVWDVQRARDLFGFDPRQQAYQHTIREHRFTPPALPILYGGSLVGRIEVQMNWVEASFVVQAIHLEAPWLQEEAEFRSSFVRALQDLANWHGASDMRLAGNLPPRLLP